jgi:N-methylhydantoinase A
VLGRLPADRLLAVETPVSVDAVRAAFEREIARPLDYTVEQAAAAVIALGNLHMAGAIRMVSLSRGHDPRDFALFAFGGAGPLHAVALARELGLPEVIVPARPGLTNALGCLVADLRQDFVNTLNEPVDAVDLGEIARILAAQRARGLALNAAESGEIVSTDVTHAAEMQFRGQTHLLRVALASATPSREELQAAFEAAYMRRFAIELPEIRAVLVNLHTTVVGRRRRFPIEALLDPSLRAPSLSRAQTGERRMYAAGAWTEARVYARERLPLGAEIRGPAVIEQVDATTVIEPGSSALVDPIGNMRVKVAA